MNQDVSKYLTQQVMSASPAKLVFMLYERAISSLREAIAAIEAGDIEGRWKANNRAMEIITHLWSTLNTDDGGDIAQNLQRLFPFMTTRLTQVDLQNDPAPAEEVIQLLIPLRDAWQALASNAAEQPASGATAAPAAPGPAPISRTSISA